MNSEKNVQVSSVSQHSSNEMLCDVLSLKDAKMLAMVEGKKIRHRYFMPDEYIVYKKDKWLTEEGIEVPYSYWLCMVPEMQTHWSAHIA